MSRPRPVADLDWGAAQARDLTDAVRDLWAELLERMRDLPVSRPFAAAEVAAAAALPIGSEPLPVADLAALLRPLVMEQSTLCGHPGFMAYVSGSGTVPGAAADLLAAALNPNVGGSDDLPGGDQLELHLMRWLADRFGLPAGAGGLMTSGGAASNLTAIKAARDYRTDGDVRRDGVDGLGPRPVRVRRGPCDDRRGGRHARAGRAGGARDRDRRRLQHAPGRAAPGRRGRHPGRPAPVCGGRDGGHHRHRRSRPAARRRGCVRGARPVAARRRGVWRGGGAGIAAAPAPRGDRAGADSIAFDPHKWLYTPQSSACLLVRDPRHLLRSYSIDAAYVRDDASLSGRGTNIGELGPQWSRSWNALKVWLSLAAHGTDAYARRIAHDVELARYLDRRVREPARSRCCRPACSGAM